MPFFCECEDPSCREIVRLDTPSRSSTAITSLAWSTSSSAPTATRWFARTPASPPGSPHTPRAEVGFGAQRPSAACCMPRPEDEPSLGCVQRRARHVPGKGSDGSFRFRSARGTVPDRARPCTGRHARRAHRTRPRRENGRRGNSAAFPRAPVAGARIEAGSDGESLRLLRSPPRRRQMASVGRRAPRARRPGSADDLRRVQREGRSSGPSDRRRVTERGAAFDAFPYRYMMDGSHARPRQPTSSTRSARATGARSSTS